MDKKKKRKIIVLVVCLVLVVAVVTAVIVYGNRGSTADQFHTDNVDTMAFNPFVENEERVDNSLLEYGKVLSKYGDRYAKYTGADISVVPSAFYGFSYSYTDGETVTIYCENEDGVITDIGYKGKKYTYDAVKNGELSFATEDFNAMILEMFGKIPFSEDYTYEYFEDIGDNRDSDGYTHKGDAEERYTKKQGVIQADSAAVQTYGGDEVTFIYRLPNIPETALYSLSVEYFLPANRANGALIGFKVNGKAPFFESTNLELKRTYDFYDVKSLDIQGNEIRARQQERFAWKDVVLESPDGMYKNPFRFVMNAGENTLSISLSREPSVIRSIKLVAPMTNDSYEEYKAANQFSEDQIINQTSQIEFETPIEKSNMSIRMEWDGNYATYPKSYEVTRYNYFGGDRWSSGGESATWKFTVPQTGWYQIGFRYQISLTDIVSYREIRIDGVIPFAEMEEYCFPYSDGWVGSPLKDENQNPYYFYLTEGEHTISIKSKLGPLRYSVQLLEEAMESISTLVNNVVSITGAVRSETGGYTVDKNRDWDLDKYIMGIQDELNAYRDSFKLIYDDIIEANGGALPYYGSAVSVAYNLFERLAEDLEDIPASLNDINSTLSGLSTTLSSITDQPLAIDYMILTGNGYDYSKCRSNSFQNFKVASIQFFDSFTKDYTMMGTREGSENEDTTEIEVYVARGREYVEMMRSLIAENFTPETGIKVNLNMVTAGIENLVMLRYITRTAPDVALSITAGTPVEYAARGALVAYNDLDGDGVDDNPEFYEMWKNSFLDGAFTLSRYRGNYYSFPETQTWSALFYRTDIIEDELDLEIPDTWDDVYEILPVLQENSLDFCYNYGVANLYPFLYQNNADIYDYNGLVSGLDTNASYNAFVEYSNLYNKYNIPYAANFYMKFKMGDMPIGIADINTYCQLKYSAPEIEGKWEMAPVPGHLLADGTVDRSMGGSLTSCVMIKNQKNLQAQAAWEFVKWWMSDETQTDYAAEVEATFGIASRWQTANKNALQQMAYSDEELAVINEQWSHFTETPVVLGGYYTTRYLTTALNKAVLQGENARIALEDAVREINKEMKRKQDEFFPDGVDSIVWKEYRTKGADN